MPMPLKLSKAMVDSKIRSAVFDSLNIANIEGFQRINERQYGCIVEDINGEKRYVRIGAIVAEVRDDMSAEELMQSEIDTYNAKQAKKAEQKAARAEKAKRDKERREKEKEGQ